MSSYNFSFPSSSLITCSSHCADKGMQCGELSSYSCLDAAKKVTHHDNTDDFFAVKTDCSAGAGCFVDRFSLVSENSDYCREMRQCCFVVL